MLLIAGGESDPNTQRVVDQAAMRDIKFFFWDTDGPHRSRIAWDFREPYLDLGSERLHPSSLYLRCNVFGGQPVLNSAVHELLQAYALAWPEVKLLNRSTITDFNNKSFNLRLAQACGFEIPDSLVIGELTPLNTMPNPASKIAKPLNGGAHTQCVKNLIESPNYLQAVGPQFIQDKLLGENLRLFSIGGKLTCFHLETTELDYREDVAVEVVEVDVPECLVDATQRLVNKKGFDYCALDFRCKNGFDSPVFLEVNSFPMFVRFDDAAENKLVDQILNFLVDN